MFNRMGLCAIVALGILFGGIMMTMAEPLSFRSATARHASIRYEKDIKAARELYLRTLEKGLKDATRKADLNDARNIEEEIKRVQQGRPQFAQKVAGTEWKWGRHLFIFGAGGKAKIWDSDGTWRVVGSNSILVTDVEGKPGWWRITFDPGFEFAIDVSHANSTAILQNVTGDK